jgi:lauroyl/myristoyl acyltransferase
MGLMETGMAWFWPTKRIARWTDSIGVEHIRDVQAQKRGILLIGIHFHAGDGRAHVRYQRAGHWRLSSKR